MPEEAGAAYDRGHMAGEIAARLAGHDKHFAAINGSLADIAGELRGLTLGVQRLADQAAASARTVIATAEALEKAEAARRGKSEQSWSPIAKVLALIGGVAAVIATAVGVYLARK